MSLRFVKQGDVYEAQLYRIEPSTSLASKWTVYCGDDSAGLDAELAVGRSNGRRPQRAAWLRGFEPPNRTHFMQVSTISRRD